MTLADLFRCVCRGRNCLEKNHIKCDNEKLFTHIRIDGCVIKSSEEKKCDCLILFFPSESPKMVMFFVECKPAGYSLREVKEQIENSINVVGKAFGQISGDVLIPVCYSKSHSSGCERAIDSYRVKSPKGLLTIKLLNYGDDITKALK